MKSISQLSFALLACAAIACNLPAAGQQADEEPAVTIIVPSATAAETTEPIAEQPTPLAPADELATAAVLIEIPPDWTVFQSDALSLTVAVPKGWEAQPINASKLDISQKNNDAWLEINEVNASNADEWSLTFQPSTEAEIVLQQLLEALQQDGTYGEPISIGTRSGNAAAVEGVDDLFTTEVLVAVLAFEQRWLLVIGHGAEPDNWPDLLTTYNQIIASIETL